MKNKEQINDPALNGLTLNTKEFVDCNILLAAIGTTGYKGGDTGHGGRTAFTLRDISGTDMRVSVGREGFYNTDQVTIAFGGDSEMVTFTQALMYAAEHMMHATSIPWYKCIAFKLKMLWWKIKG